jgi:hypothetical protein
LFACLLIQARAQHVSIINTDAGSAATNSAATFDPAGAATNAYTGATNAIPTAVANAAIGGANTGTLGASQHVYVSSALTGTYTLQQLSLPPTAFYAPLGDTFNAVAGQIIFVDPNATTSGGVPGTVELPPSPNNGDVVMIKDAGASDGTTGFSECPLTVDGNGNIVNASSSVTLSTDNSFTFFIWDDLNQWIQGSM